MKKNIIRAMGVSGIYRDKEIEIHIGASSDKTIIKVNGKPVDLIFGAHIHMRTGEMTTVVLEKYTGDLK